MKTLRLLAAPALAGLMLLSGSAAAWAWGAIAVSNKQASRWGYAYDSSTKQEAIDRALRNCGRNCQVVLTFARGCGAYAYGAYGKDTEYGTGVGSSRAAAEELALIDCEMMLWGECRIRVWACNSR
ncbi:MAG TPA: DUF4189 domain-containing protein [Hyphomicrobiales bacterium]|nr:DUF4189 domain-containing protein [Hyphomicrobiales bacterium]